MLIVILPSLSILAFTFPVLFNEKPDDRHTAYTVISPLTILFSSKSGAVAVLLFDQPRNSYPSLSGLISGNLPPKSFMLFPFSMIS